MTGENRAAFDIEPADAERESEEASPVVLVCVDRHVGLGSVLGSGKLNWGQEAGGLVVLIVGLAAPLILKARRPQTGREVLWGIVACAAVTALLIVPLQALVAGYVALIFAAP